MKFSKSCFVLLLAGATVAGLPATYAQSNNNRGVIVVPRAPIPDGSNASRAPYLANRPHNDGTAANGQAVDQDIPPNTPSTQEPTPAAPRVAVGDGRAGPPALTPTGRPTTGLGSIIEPAKMSAALRASAADRVQVVGDIETRLKAVDNAYASLSATDASMSEAGRAQFRTAADNFEAREKELRGTLTAVRRTGDRSDEAWGRLATEFDAFAAAAAQLDTLSGITPAQ